MGLCVMHDRQNGRYLGRIPVSSGAGDGTKISEYLNLSDGLVS